MDWSHTCLWQLGIKRVISAVAILLGEQEVLVPHQPLQLMIPMLEKEVPKISGCDNKQDLGWVRQRDSGFANISLKELM